jgi:hypothetical protein
MRLMALIPCARMVAAWPENVEQSPQYRTAQKNLVLNEGDPCIAVDKKKRPSVPAKSISAQTVARAGAPDVLQRCFGDCYKLTRRRRLCVIPRRRDANASD